MHGWWCVQQGLHDSPGLLHTVLPQVFTTDPDVVRAQYPRADDFRRLAAELDPSGTFRNDLLDRYLPVL